MDKREALHTAARRHCTEMHSFWSESYCQLGSAGEVTKPVDRLTLEQPQQACVKFPRYLVWEAILKEVERLTPRSLSSLGELRQELAAAGMRAQTMMTTNPGLPAVAGIAMEEEREAFRKFVLSFPEDSLEEVEPLAIRRGFNVEELRRVWGILDRHWEVKLGHYWWPLREGIPPEEVIAFHTDWFNSEKIAALRNALIGHGVELVWELREFGEWGCEKDVSSFNPVYNGEEGYWTSMGTDWLVYASHESSITLGGAWLVGAFRQSFPGCDQYEYEGPMSTADQRGTWKF